MTDMGPLFRMEAKADGPFAASKIEPSGIERVIAEIIWTHRGRKNPISIDMLSRSVGRDERTVKGVVEQLVVTHGLKIGGSRAEAGGGYFVVVDAEDLEAAVRPYRSQILAMWRRLRVLCEAHALRELHGQLTIEEGGE
jgi:hypothetical protein